MDKSTEKILIEIEKRLSNIEGFFENYAKIADNTSEWMETLSEGVKGIQEWIIENIKTVKDYKPTEKKKDNLPEE